MNEFAQNFAPVFEVSLGIFGEPCTIDGRPFPCVVQTLTASNGVDNPRAGRSQIVEGSIAISRATLFASRCAKGSKIGISGLCYRVKNDPNAGPESETVILELGAYT